MSVQAITLRQLRAFIAVAKHGNYTRAAEHICLSQPALTSSILALEDLLRLRLIDRDTRNVELTDAGKEFLTGAQRVVTELDLLIESTESRAGLREGEVVVACLPSTIETVLGPCLTLFSQQFPGVRIRIRDVNDSEISSLVLSRDCDFGIGGRPNERKAVVFSPLYEDTFHVLFRRGHRFEQLDTVPLAEVLRERLVLQSIATGMRQLFEGAAARAGIKFEVHCEAEQLSTLMVLVEKGLGIAPVTSFCLSLMPSPHLESRVITEPLIIRPLGIISREGSTLFPAAEKFRLLVKMTMDRLAAATRT